MSSMITCMAWVKRGIAKEIPDKVELSQEQIQELIEEAQEKLIESEKQDQASAENVQEPSVEEILKKSEKLNTGDIPSDEEDSEDEIIKEYGLDDYDNEEEEAEPVATGLSGLTYYATNDDDPHITLKNQEEEDRDDFVIQQTDNLLVAGTAQEDYSNLEIYIYNEEEESQYVHHDIILEAFPLALEWLDFDSETPDKPGNYIAIGSMKPQIEIWDLDVVDTMEPVMVLGGKRRKSLKKITSSGEGHTDAVLDLSWNHLVRNVLSSASADHTVRLWDMAQAKSIHVLQHHKNKVQSVKWHPYEPQSLLTGGFDKRVHVVDCRNPETNIKTWKLNGEVERAIWNHFSPFHFLAGTENGFVYCCDVRSDKPIFTISAHDDSVSGLALSSQIPGCLVTVSADKSVKVWDIQDNKPSFVMSRTLKMGNILTVSCCPDSPFIFSVGGEKQGVKIIDINESAPVRSHFEGRQRLSAVSNQTAQNTSPETSAAMEMPSASSAKDNEGTHEDSEPMDEDDTVTNMKDLSLSEEAAASSTTGKKKKKKKKK